MKPNFFSWAGPLAVVGFTLGILTVLGLPVSMLLLRWSGQRVGVIAQRGLVVATPLFGLSVGALGAVGGLRLHLDQGIVLAGLLTGAVAVSISQLREFSLRFPRAPGRWAWLAGPITLAALAVALHSMDLVGLRAGEYFPRTNDDTFVYLGAIDQVAAQGAMSPPIRYPSGVSTVLGGIVDLRAASVAWAAGVAALLHLEPHIVFFGLLRTTLPLGVLGVFALGALLEWPASACLAAGWLFTVGNFACHQVFQQFLSSATGMIGSMGAVCILLLTVRSGFSWAVAATAASATAAAGMLSPETFPLLVIGAGAGLTLASWQQRPVPEWRALLFAAATFVLVTAGVVAAMLPGIYGAILGQTGSARAHPGDWIAQRGFLSQSFGLQAMFDGRALTLTTVVLLWCLLPLGMLGVLSLTAGAAPRGTGRHGAASRFLGGAMLAWVGLFAAFLALGRGYAMLKVNDYFCFVLPVAIVAGARLLGGVLPGRVLPVLAGIGLLLHAAVAYPEKLRLLSRYRLNVRQAPPPSAYRLPPGVAGGVLPELGGVYVLNLFVYLNRWESTQILFPAADSVRFQPAAPTDAPNAPVADYLFRLGAMPAGGDAFADIDRFNRPGAGGTYLPPRVFTPNRGCVRLVNPPFAPSPAWAGLEGDQPTNLFRWLLGEGGFRVYGPAVDAPPRQLILRVLAGPDLRPENVVRVTLDGQIRLEISATELLDRGPREFHFPLPIPAATVSIGKLTVEGPRSGLYQLAVRQIFAE